MSKPKTRAERIKENIEYIGKFNVEYKCTEEELQLNDLPFLPDVTVQAILELKRIDGYGVVIIKKIIMQDAGIVWIDDLRPLKSKLTKIGFELIENKTNGKQEHPY